MGGLRRIAGISLVASCGFSPSQAAIDAKVADTLPDAPGGPPLSCKDLLATHPGTPDGSYMVDPDGDGPEPITMVTCDMRTLGGGWTLILEPPTNAVGLPDYEVPLSLLASAGTVLVGYRSSANLIEPNFAAFDLPVLWRTQTPFAIAESQFSTPVGMNGDVPASAMVFAGYENFNGSLCSDVWTPGSMFGRFCIAGTKAPFYNGFVTISPDNCSDSSASWNGTPCGGERRFSMAVR